MSPVLWRTAFGAATAIVIMLSLLPSAALPPAVPIGDKLEHGLAYAVLALLGAVADPQTRRLHLTAALLVALGGLLEIAQLWVPGREGEWLDFAADAAGVALGAGAIRMLAARRAAILVRLRGGTPL